jgi:hypothetical protein
MIGNALRPFAPVAFLLVGAGALPSTGSHALTTLSPSHALTLSQSSERRVQRLSEPELTGLLGDLNERAVVEVDGFRKAVSAFLTEAEARKVLEAFLKKNGLAPKPLLVSRPGVDFEADASADGLAIEIRGAADEGCHSYNFKLAEGDLTEEEADELRLLAARGEARVLLLDGRAYEYDKYGDYAGRLPDKRAAVRRLLADLERFLERNR